MDGIGTAVSGTRGHRWQAWGLAVVLLGVLALFMPMLAGLAVVFVIGAFLVISGLAHAMHTMQLRLVGGGSFLGFISAILSILAGVLVILHPVLGLTFLSALIIVYFFAQGGIIIAHAAIGPGKGRLLAQGLMEILLGVLFVFQWPLSGQWALGILVGAHLLFKGGWMLWVQAPTAAQAVEPVASKISVD